MSLPHSSENAAAPQREPRLRGHRLAALDGLRLLAALWVVLFHYVGVGSAAWGQPVSQLFPALHQVARYGSLGVQLFFLISGFVICMSAWDRGVGHFVVSRVTRLFPAYWFAVLATTVGLLVLRPSAGVPALADVLINFTMLQSPLDVALVDLAYWTLWQELLFYLIFSVVVWRGLTYRRVLVFCLLWMTAAVLAPRSGLPLLVTLAQPDFAMFFIAGIVMFLMYRFRPNLVLWGILAGCFLLSTRPIMAQHRGWNSANGPGPTWWGVLGLEIVIFAVMLAVALGHLRLRWRWLTVGGTLTYPLYLLHQLIGASLIEVLRHRVPGPLLLGGLVVAMLLVAWLVHRLIERPLARWLRPRLLAATVDIPRRSARPLRRTCTGLVDCRLDDRCATARLARGGRCPA